MEPTTRTYERVIQYVLSQPWAIRELELSIIQDVLRLRASGLKFSAEELAERIGTPQARSGEASSNGSIAVVPVWGVIGHRANELRAVSSGIGTSTEILGAQIDLLVAEPSVSAIVLDINSPGGGVFGLPEVAAQIRAARSKKPIVAVANALMASGAYWIGASASELVVTPSGLAGSIGVFSVHEDLSQKLAKDGVAVTLIRAGKYKAEDNPFGPLTEEAIAATQSRVDEYYALFTKDIAKGRNVAIETVRNGFGEGRVVNAKQAVSLGMADRVATLDEVIADLAAGKMPKKAAAAFDDEPDIMAARHETAMLAVVTAMSEPISTENPAISVENEPVIEEQAAPEPKPWEAEVQRRKHLLRIAELG